MPGADIDEKMQSLTNMLAEQKEELIQQNAADPVVQMHKCQYEIDYDAY